MSNYWVDRAAEQARKQYDKSLEDLEKELSRYYKIALKGVRADTVALFQKIHDEMEKGEPLGTDSLYKYNRFIQLRNRIQQELNRLGTEEIKAMGRKYEDMARYVNHFIADEAKGTISKDFLLLDNEKVKEIANSVWCADGKHWSERVWDKTRRLQSSIEKGLVDSVARGASKDDLVKDLQSIFGASFSNADRIARTELAHVQNRSTLESYKKAGVEYVETIVAKDERLCDTCSRHNGQITPIGEAREGKAFLFHPNCRCDIVPYMAGKEDLTRDAKEDRVENRNDGKTKKQKGIRTIFKQLEDIKNYDWSKAGFATPEKQQHHKKHLAEYGNISIEEYIEKARDLLNADESEDIIAFVGDAGFLYKYRISSNDFALGSPEGNISTLYKLKGGFSAFKDLRDENEWKRIL